jgi:hypothetical protein
MITNSPSEMKTVLSRMETTVSNPVVKKLDLYYEIQGLALKVDWARLYVRDLMISVITDCAIGYDRMTDQDAKSIATEIYCKGGIEGLVKRLAEISDFLHLESFRLEQKEQFEEVS